MNHCESLVSFFITITQADKSAEFTHSALTGAETAVELKKIIEVHLDDLI